MSEKTGIEKHKGNTAQDSNILDELRNQIHVLDGDIFISLRGGLGLGPRGILEPSFRPPNRFCVYKTDILPVLDFDLITSETIRSVGLEAVLKSNF